MRTLVYFFSASPYSFVPVCQKKFASQPWREFVNNFVFRFYFWLYDSTSGEAEEFPDNFWFNGQAGKKILVFYGW
jgi:hypothetical protein